MPWRSVVREGQLANVEAAGQQGHFVVAAYGPDYAPSSIAAMAGVLLPGAPIKLVPLGRLVGAPAESRIADRIGWPRQAHDGAR